MSLFQPSPETDTELMQWALNVKTAAHWTCQEPGCWVRDRQLLDAHHIEPIGVNPARKYDCDNGCCLCLPHHALRHTGITRLLVILRWAIVEVRMLRAKVE